MTTEQGLLGILISILLSTFRVSVPLVFTSMGGIFSERSGVVNIALEGLMLVGAFAAAATAFVTHSPWIGAVAGVAAGVALAAIYGLFVIESRSDQIVAGTAVNLLAFGVTPMLAKALFDTAGTTPSLEMGDRFGSEPLYLAFAVVVGIAFWFRHSRLGLWLGFAGEHPEALSTAGIRVKRVRWFGVLMAGALAGLGGATLSIFLSSSFSRGMTAGRGFMALAALIFGKWKPVPTFFACLFFGLTDAIQIRLQGVPIFGEEPIPVQFIQILPYVVTVLVLAGFMGKSRPPKALGSPWVGLFAVFALPTVLLGSGCNFDFQGPINRLRGRESPVAVNSPSGGASAVGPERSRANAELLAEMSRVVFNREPQSLERFAAFHASLDQGASLEGVLNGWLHSSVYRDLERDSPVASPAARTFFVDELFRIQSEIAARGNPGFRPVPISRTSGKPLATIDFPTGSANDRAKAEAASEFDAAKSRAFYNEVFATSSLPVLKRVLYEALLARIDADSASDRRAPLAAWYADLSVRLAGAGVDFGLPLRNRADAPFHREWAAQATTDRILWEATNRFFRILNRLSSGGPS
jgi:simple sugar transport system permease protein